MKDDRKAPRLHFAALLRKYREEAGHGNARAFFEAQGGRKFFGCTYRAYLDVEKGESVPRPAMVERLVAALRIAIDEEKAREFASAYLQTLLGLNPFLEFASRALAGAPVQTRPGEDEERAFPAEALGLLCGDSKSYWCFTLLSQDSEGLTPAELSQALDLPEGEAAEALRLLERAGLVRKGKAERWSAAAPAHPEAGAGSVELAALSRHWEELLSRRGGEVIHEHPAMTRCSVSALREYFPYLSHGLMAAAQLSTKQKGDDTGLFLLEVSAEKLLPY